MTLYNRLRAAIQAAVVETAAALPIEARLHRDNIVLMNGAAAQVFTLPKATGSGDYYKLIVGTTNQKTIKVQDSIDTMQGWADIAISAGAATNFGTVNGTSDTIILNNTTTGGVIGFVVELIDVGPGIWQVLAEGIGSGTLATPFSATV